MSAYSAAITGLNINPTLSGATGPRGWTVGAKTYSSAVDTRTDLGSSIAYSNTGWVNFWFKPSAVTGLKCFYEAGGATHGISVWQDGDDVVVVAARGGVANNYRASNCLTTGVWTNVHAVWLPSTCGIALDGGTLNTAAATSHTTSGTDAGAVGGIAGTCLTPAGDSVSTVADHLIGGDLADFYGKYGNDGSALGPILYLGPTPTNTVAPTFNATTGDWAVGTWDSYSNGSLTYTVTLRDDTDDSLVATLQTGSATTSGNCLSDLVTAGAGTYYIEVVAANDGGDSDVEQSATGIYFPDDFPSIVLPPPVRFALPIYRSVWHP